MTTAELPNRTTTTLNAWSHKPSPQGPPRMVVLGAGGQIGSVTGHCFKEENVVLTGFDLKDNNNPDIYESWHTGNTADLTAVRESLVDADYVLYLPTGSGAGWQAIVDAEIHGIKNVAQACVESGVNRLMYAPSNHVTGMNEVEFHETGHLAKARPTSMPRPDGLYGSAKAFAEALLRSASEIHGLPVSVIRIGSMRAEDDPRAVADGPRFPGQTDDQYHQRMESVWLTHQDWKDTILREMEAVDQFRLFYASQDQTETPWTHEVYTWNPR